MTTVFCQRIFPSVRFKQRSARARSSGMAVTVKMRSFQTIGEACPTPGTSVFQATFAVALQFLGICVSRLVPSPRGPRQHGQFSARDVSAAIATRTVTTSRWTQFTTEHRGSFMRSAHEPGNFGQSLNPVANVVQNFGLLANFPGAIQSPDQ